MKRNSVDHLVKPGTELYDRGLCITAVTWCGHPVDYPGMKLKVGLVCESE